MWLITVGLADGTYWNIVAQTVAALRASVKIQDIDAKESQLRRESYATEVAYGLANPEILSKSLLTEIPEWMWMPLLRYDPGFFDDGSYNWVNKNTL